MKTEDFMNYVVEPRLEFCKSLLSGSKNKEYTRNDDKFHNFKAAAREDDITPERALRGMWRKHLISVKDIIDDLDKGIIPEQKILDEKITDNINYLLLLEGIIIDRIRNMELSSDKPEPQAITLQQIALMSIVNPDYYPAIKVREV